MRTKLLLATIIAAFCIIPATAQTTLQLNLQKGETYYQSSTATVKTEQSVGGMSISITVIMDLRNSYKVINITGDNYDLEVKYEKLAVSTNTPQGSLSFSSENPKDATSSYLAEATKHPFNVKMNKSGEILEVTNFEKLTSGEGLSAIEKEQIVQILSEEQFKKNMETMTAIYPKSAVAKGDSWEKKDVINSGGMDLTMTSKYTLAETGSSNKISGAMTFSTDPNAAPIESQGMSMRLNLNGTGTADITLDAKSGWITEATIKQNITGEAQILDGMAAGMNIPMSINNTTTVNSK